MIDLILGHLSPEVIHQTAQLIYNEVDWTKRKRSRKHIVVLDLLEKEYLCKTGKPLKLKYG